MKSECKGFTEGESCNATFEAENRYGLIVKEIAHYLDPKSSKLYVKGYSDKEHTHRKFLEEGGKVIREYVRGERGSFDTLIERDGIWLRVSKDTDYIESYTGTNIE